MQFFRDSTADTPVPRRAVNWSVNVIVRVPSGATVAVVAEPTGQPFPLVCTSWITIPLVVEIGVNAWPAVAVTGEASNERAAPPAASMLNMTLLPVATTSVRRRPGH